MLQSETVIYVTSCTLKMLQRMGSHYKGALLICKTFKELVCKHEDCNKNAINSLKCISEHLKQKNYVIAAQTLKLRKMVRSKLSNGKPVPLIFISGRVPNLEKPTERDLDFALKKERLKFGQKNKKVVKKIKNPNPLSCKKPTTKIDKNRSKNKRKRSRSKKKPFGLSK
ncbi:Small subunit processome component [Bonamia ostreae]